MSDQGVFENSNEEIVAPAAAPVVTEPTVQHVEQPAAIALPDSVKELIGEGKKYLTVEDALNSIPHAQSHIKSVEEEAANLREDIAKHEAIEQVLEKIKGEKTSNETDTPLSAEELESLIDNRLVAKEAQFIAKANQKLVATEFTEKFGEKAKEVFHAKAKELGLSVPELDSLSARSPDAVYKMCGLDVNVGLPPKIQSDFNSEANHQSQRPEVPKSVMGRSTLKDDKAAWNACAPKE